MKKKSLEPITWGFDADFEAYLEELLSEDGAAQSTHALRLVVDNSESE